MNTHIPQSKGRLYFLNSKAIYMGKIADTSIHQHHAIQIAIAPREPFKLKAAEKIYQCRMLIIDSGQPHQFIGEDFNIILLIDPESEEGKALKRLVITESKIKVLKFSQIESLLNHNLNISEPLYGYNQIDMLCTHIIYAICDTKQSLQRLDPRIKEGVDLLKALPSTSVSIKELAERVYLSESRLMHLFKEQLGIPYRKYVLFVRLKYAINLIIEGKTLTEAAHQAEFADSAHLSRTFRQMFGLTPSEVFKNSQFIQVITDKV